MSAVPITVQEFNNIGTTFSYYAVHYDVHHEIGDGSAYFTTILVSPPYAIVDVDCWWLTFMARTALRHDGPYPAWLRDPSFRVELTPPTSKPSKTSLSSLLGSLLLAPCQRSDDPQATADELVFRESAWRALSKQAIRPGRFARRHKEIIRRDWVRTQAQTNKNK